jgi:hypothetical protein
VKKRRNSSKTKQHSEHIAHAARKTHQRDHAEAVKYLRGAADVLQGRGEARGEGERVSDDTRPTHTNNYAHHQKLKRKNSGDTQNAPEG